MQIRCGSWSDLKKNLQIVKFFHENYTLGTVGNRSEKIGTYGGIKAFFERHETRFIVNFVEFPCSWIHIHNPDLDPVQGQQNQCGSTTLYKTFFICVCLLFTSMLKKVVLIRLQNRSLDFLSLSLCLFMHYPA
jgi:hypothetical protein